MDNTVFNKRLKIGAIVVASVVAVLSIIWYISKEDNTTSTKPLHTANSVSNEIADVIERSGAYYVNIDSLHKAEDSAYFFCEKNYPLIRQYNLAKARLFLKYESINYKESISDSERYIINGVDLLVDNYRRFMTDTAECNKGREPLRLFIYKILNDYEFRESRTSLCAEEQEMSGGVLCGFKFEYDNLWIMSWVYLSSDKAVFLLWQNADAYESWTFKRIDGDWYFTNYFEEDPCM